MLSGVRQSRPRFFIILALMIAVFVPGDPALAEDPARRSDRSEFLSLIDDRPHRWAGDVPNDDDQDDPAYRTYREGYDLVMREQWKEARKRFEEVLSRFSASPYTDDARYWLAYSLKQTDHERAISAYHKFIERHQHSRYYDDAVADLHELERAFSVSTSTHGDSVAVTVGSDGHTVTIRMKSRSEAGTLSQQIAEQRLRRLSEYRAPKLRALSIPQPAHPLLSADSLNAELQNQVESLYSLAKKRNDPESFAALRRIATDPAQPRPLRFAAMETLSEFPTPEAVSVYVTIARRDTSEDIQNMAIESISAVPIEQKKRVDVLIDLYSSVPGNQPEKRRTVLYSIAEIGTNGAVRFLRNVALKEQQDDLRSDVIYLISNIGSDSARSALYEILQSLPRKIK